MKIIEIASVLQRKTHYNQSGRALLPALKLRQKGLVTATSGLSPLRDFHSIKFRPADIPVWLDTSRERLLRATRPLRLRLRCQEEKRCRSKVRHKCRPYQRPGSLASGGQDCGNCPLRVQVPQTCFRLPHCGEDVTGSGPRRIESLGQDRDCRRLRDFGLGRPRPSGGIYQEFRN